MKNRCFYPILLLWTLFSGVSTASGQVVLSEMMSANSQTVRDEDGDTPDWIELYNAGNVPVNLQGWYLTDDSLETGKWQFPAVTLSPGGYLLVFASDKDRKSGPFLHAGFRLGAGREPVLLSDPSGQLVDYLPARCIPTDVSFGRSPATGFRAFHFSRPTPGQSNDTNSRFTITEGQDTVLFSQPVGVFTSSF